jgi:hypothetical protein
MIEQLDGEFYWYNLEWEPNKKRYIFQIRAIDKRTRRYSLITNVTHVMGLLGVEDKPRFEETHWIITERELQSFSKAFKSVLCKPRQLKHLENELDEDREDGEWEKWFF